MAWLDDHPPDTPQFRRPRREAPSGVCVVHTAENIPDFIGIDAGAEGVANFIRTRDNPGSYHDLADSDSCINLVDYDCEAFHDGTGSNRHSYGVSIATRAAVWPNTPITWRDGAIQQAAAAASRYAHWLRGRRGIVIPARRINRTQSEARTPGFISHAERDPARRTDPGASFPWNLFLAEYARLTADLNPAKPGREEIELLLIRSDEKGSVLLLSGGVTFLVESTESLNDHLRAGIPLISVPHTQFERYEKVRAA